MSFTTGNKLAVYVLLSHPLSFIRKRAEFLPAQATQADAVTSVVNMLARHLKITVTADINALTSFIASKNVIDFDPVSALYKISTDQQTLAALDGGYSSDTGCPDENQSGGIYGGLGLLTASKASRKAPKKKSARKQAAKKES